LETRKNTQGHLMTLNDIPPKPVAEIWRPDLVKLPERPLWRRFARGVFRKLARLLLRVLVRLDVTGLEHFPKEGPALVIFNHLGDGDVVALLGILPVEMDFLAKIDLTDDMPLIARLAALYGVIWVHRGRPDRRALRSGLDALADGRFLGVAPEARYSLTGALEPATEGAAFLALQSGAPVVPVALMGTENVNLYPNLKRLRRPQVRVRIGQPFHVQMQPGESRRAAIDRITDEMMCHLARLLEPAYRGVYEKCV
jgi:1-acyl-sn-glycerol-3-phosphate acyltransferase